MFKKIWDRIVELFTKDPPREIRAVDLPAELDRLAEADGRNLNWRTSVVDFLELIGADSSKANRDALADELNVADYVSGTAASNEALRKALYKEVEANGGNVPQELLD